MRRYLAAILGAALLPATGCDGLAPFVCPREAIRATLTTPLVGGEDASSDLMAGNLEAREDRSETLEAVEDVIEGRTLQGGRGVSMWLQRGLDHTLNLTLRFPTPLRPGDVLPVVETHSAERPFWGTLANPAPGLSVGVQLDDFLATSASGNARVLGLDPLRVELHVVASSPGRQVPIDGVLVVRHESSTDTCFE